MSAPKKVQRLPIKFLKSSFEHLGDNVEVPMPPCTDMIVLCVDTNSGHKPRSVLLPHQLYREELKKILKEPGVNSVTVIPYKNEEKIEITLKDL